MSIHNLQPKTSIETGKFGKKCLKRGKYKNCANSSVMKAGSSEKVIMIECRRLVDTEAL